VVRRISGLRRELWPLAVLLALALLWFAPVLFLGRTLLPYDNLYTFEPWRSLRPGLVPHNGLLSDLVLENAVWKLHIRRTLAQGQLPLWNPQIFTGLPFLAAGQSSALYPLSLLFYVLPLEAAYGWFTALQLALAGCNMYILARVLGLRPLPALFSGVVYQFSGFMVVSVVFTMVIAAVAWLPLLLAIVERVIQKQEAKGLTRFRPVPYVVLGAGVLGLVALAGHPEFYYYTLLVTGFYSAARLLLAWRRLRARNQGAPSSRGRSPLGRVLALALWLLALALLGVAAGGVQILPLYELVTLNFREGSASYAQVVGWAWPVRQVLTFFLPDIFGNPSHHAWFDLWNLRWEPVRVNALGEPIDTVFWGIKNYVEGGNYLGLLTWLLAAVAVVTAARREDGSTRSRRPPHGPPTGQLVPATWIFASLAVISLLFAFGTPLYALLYYGLPGWNQLHSPFRWVFPFTLSMAVLAGIGLQQIRARHGGWGPWQGRAPFSVLPGLILGYLPLAAVLAGLAALLAVVASYFLPAPFIALGERVLAASDLARRSFADGRMFWGYQSVNLFKFGLFALLSGGILWALRRGQGDESRLGGWRWGGGLLVLIVFLDLYAAHGRFNPATDPSLSPLVNVPPVVAFLETQGREPAGDGSSPPGPLSPWRFTTFDLPGAKTFNANVGMYYGWHDIRGYDSIIPRQYVALMERIQDQSGELLYNRIAPLYAQGPRPLEVLENPLLDLLNVRYLLTETELPGIASWRLVYQDGSIRVYENLEVFPRAFLVPRAEVVPPEQQPLVQADLRRVVFIEEAPADPNGRISSSPQVAEARISRYTANDVFVDVNLSDRAWLVLTDAYFPGWKAYVRPFGGDESQEVELPIYRAYGAFRAVYLAEPGPWTVRFVYSPMSFKLGLYLSFLAGMAGLLLLLWWGWGRYYRPEVETDEVRTVAKNSLVPMGLSLANKAIDFAFAMLYVRILGPEGTGKYAFVVAVYGFFEIVSRYGLGTLLTREVAADRNQSSRYLTNVLALRTGLWLASMPVLALVTYGYWAVGTVGREEIWAIALFGLAMLFANWADAFSALFYAFEKMEYPAGLSSATALMKVALGALALLLGWGFVGLAGVSLAMNVLQGIWLYLLVRSTLFPPQWRWDGRLQRWMLSTSGPLMINHLLATIFWRIDLWILRPLAGAFSVGLYSAALKYLDGLNIIPSTFTFAIFPLMSRYARREREGLLRAYVLSVRLLLMVSLPLAMTIAVLAEPLIYILGGVEFLHVPETIQVLGRTLSYRGGSALALQVIIWSIPIGFVNSVTQYVLIAVDQQRYLTKAFLLGVAFNVVGNLLFIPTFGYLGAAVVTILSEFSLLLPFYWSVRRHVGKVPWWDLAWRPAVAALAMGGTMLGLQTMGISPWMALVPGWGIYGMALLVVGGFRGEDMALLARALPFGPLRRFLPAVG